MHIALLTDGLTPYVIGGMQKHSYYLCRFLLEKGVRVDLFQPRVEGYLNQNPFPEFGPDRFQNHLIEWPQGDTLPGHYLRESKQFSQRVFDLYSELGLNPDLIYAKGFTGWEFIRQNKTLPPVGVKFHGYEMWQKPASAKHFLEHLLLRPTVKKINRKADVVFSYGGKITQIIKDLGVDANSIYEIPTGIAAEWLAPADSTSVGQPRKFLFLGRNERRKGINELNQVLKKLAGGNWSFEFIGPIPPADQLAGANFKYHGETRDADKIKKLLQAGDVLVTPSWSEGMPNVILEAMASGCAIIATDVGAVSEQVDAQNGWLIPPGDKKALKRAIEQAIHCPEEELLAKKQASIQRVKDKFLWDQVINQTIAAFEEIIERHRAKRNA